MKQIDEFVNSIYSDVSGKETIELKQEMRSHLLEAVSELKAEGKSEKEAIDIALSRFGDENQITRGLFSLFKTQNNVIRNLFRTSMTSLFLGLIVLIGLIWAENNNQNKLNNINLTVSSVNEILADGVFTEEGNKKINSIVEGTKEIDYFVLYKNSEPGKTPAMHPLQEGSESWKVEIEFGNSSIMNSKEYVLVDKKDPYENYHMLLSYNKIPTLVNFYSIPIGLFIVFAVLVLTSFFLKMNTNRKMLSVFVK